MKHLIKNKDGSVIIMETCSDDIDPQAEVEKWDDQMKNGVDSHCPLEESDIPQDYTFREAWEHKDDKIYFNIEKCKEIHKDTLRALRKPKLEELDVEYMRALEAGETDEQNIIAIKKKRLRDVTVNPKLLNATTVEEIKNYIPDFLK